MSGLDELRVSFFQECEDLLESLGDGLREMSDAADQPPQDETMETVHAVFRSVHSIKGGAGAFGLDDLVTFAHLFETVLDHMRDGKMPITSEAMHVLLRAGDMLSDLVVCARDDLPPEAERMSQLLAELDALADGAGVEEDDVPFEFVPTGVAMGPAGDDGGLPPLGIDLPPIDLPPAEGDERRSSDASTEGIKRGQFQISFKPHAALYDTGNDALALIRALGQLGELKTTPQMGNVRPLNDFDPSETHLSWTLTLDTEETEDGIRSIFEFVTDVADLSIETSELAQSPHATDDASEPTDSDVPDTMRTDSEGAGNDSTEAVSQPAASAPDPTQPSADVTPLNPPDASSTTDSTGSSKQPSGGAAQKPTASAAKPAQDTKTANTPPSTIRVNLDRVDRLINLIGELVIMEAMLSQAVETAGLESNSDVSNGLDGIKQLASGIQESVMAIRAQPLKPVFQRMHRIIREAGDATGKKVNLVNVGENTEVDKTVIERLVDPLTHMIRNSVDHGLEDGATRIAAGKSETGTITLSAAHRSGRVIIEVTDDGGGINREKVREIAERKELVAPGAVMSPSEIDNLLFMPGFSSKDEVSALSGRGVGLDVVRREIQALGGRVTIQSSAGEGTTFTIALPLTLAVLEGMLVEFDGEMMVLPLSAILETLRPSSATIHAIGHSGRVVSNRGELIPIIDLGEAFHVTGRKDATERDVFLLVESEGGRRAALAVDLIHDQRQVVIKSLEENYGAIPGISAATILGDGRIALIVDPEEIIEATVPDAANRPIAANE